jgi:SPP1 family predicted phage head-tail adaptor
MRGAGSLDRRITIQRATEGAQDGFGHPAMTWVSLTTVWASRADVSDGERVAAGQRDTSLMSRFVIRSSAIARTVTAIDRISYDGAIWQIKGVKETGAGRLRFIEITAVKDSD